VFSGHNLPQLSVNALISRPKRNNADFTALQHPTHLNLSIGAINCWALRRRSSPSVDRFPWSPLCHCQQTRFSAMFTVHTQHSSCALPQRRTDGRAYNVYRVRISNLGVYDLRDCPIDNEVTFPSKPQTLINSRHSRSGKPEHIKGAHRRINAAYGVLSNPQKPSAHENCGKPTLYWQIDRDVPLCHDCRRKA
jgi:hypothetical protein